jgi:hypothetical protein
MGELEMSVCADSTGVEIIDDSTSAQPVAWRSVARPRGSIRYLSFMLFSLEVRTRGAPQLVATSITWM